MNRFSYFKKVRVLLGALVLLILSIVFLDIYHLLPISFVKKALFLQIVPSFINLLKAGSIVISGFLVISIISILLGRVYCSVFCPLGIFMDLLLFLKRKIRRKKERFAKRSKYKYLPYGILTLVVFTVAVGNVQLLGLLDPYSNFGRIYTVLFKPIVIGINNLTYDVLLYFDNYSLQPIESNIANIPVFVFVLLFFLAIVVLTLTKGRFFCTHICPAGSYLSVLSNWSLFKIRIDRTKCISCGKCEIECKASCISAKDKTVDFSKCVMCLNCVSIKCPTDSISLVSKRNHIQNTADKKQEASDVSRRQLVKSMAVSPILLTKQLYGSEEKDNEKHLKIRTVPITPPGSLNQKHFIESCTACYLCVNECPSNVIKPSITEYGMQALFLPQLTNEKGYCNLECTRCSDVCPNGALLPVSKEEKKTLQIGIAHFVRERCVVITDGTDCGACSEHCPTKAVNMVQENGLFVPVVTENICIGCGACEYACPVTAPKAILVEGNCFHQVAQKPKVEKLTPVDQEEDFPF